MSDGHFGYATYGDGYYGSTVASSLAQPQMEWALSGPPGLFNERPRELPQRRKKHSRLAEMFAQTRSVP